MILSASRRTDIPSFYSEWFMNRLIEGYAITKNPMNPSQISKITLTPKDIDCIVFWTKDPLPMMGCLEQLDAMGYQYYFQFTLTPYDKILERNLRDKQAILETFRILSRTIGPDRVLWRYDPIVLNRELTVDYHKESFDKLCKELRDYTKVCTISFIDLYNKLTKSVKADLIREITEEEIHALAQHFSKVGAEHGIEVKACCEKLDLSTDGIKTAACIDKALIEQLCGHDVRTLKDKSQRQNCGCIKSVDIGVYNTCMNGCVYCYANHSDESILRNFTEHDPNAPILAGTLPPDVTIRDRNGDTAR